MRKLFTTAIALFSIMCAIAQTFDYKDGDGYNLSYEINPDDTTVTCKGLANGVEAGTADLVIPTKVSNTPSGGVKMDYTVTAVDDDAFVDSVFTGTLTLGDELTSIGESAFNGCGFTGDLIIPNKVENINSQAFSSCGFNGSLTIGTNVQFIEEFAFSFCSGFTKVISRATTPPTLGSDVFYVEDITNAIILYVPKNTANFYAETWTSFLSIETISEVPLMFEEIETDGCKLKYILNPETKTAKCALLLNVGEIGNLTIPETITHKEETYTVTSVGAGAFTTNTDFQLNVTLPNSVEELGEGCFASPTIIGVTLPKDLMIIPASCFEGAGITTIDLPNRLIRIEESAFAKTALKGITLPKELNYIGNFAFEGFNGDSIVALSENPIYLSNTPNVFGEQYNYLDVKLIVPFDSEDNYRNAEVWQNFEKIFSPEGINVEEDIIHFYNEDQPIRSVFVNANVNWTVKTDADWFTVKQAEVNSDSLIPNEFILELIDPKNTLSQEGKVVLTAVGASTVKPIEVKIEKRGAISILKQIDSIVIDIDSICEPIDLTDYFTYGDNSKLQFYPNTWSEPSDEVQEEIMDQEPQKSVTVTINGSKMGFIVNSVGTTNVGIEAMVILNNKEPNNPDYPDQPHQEPIREYMRFSIIVTDDDSEVNPKPKCAFTVDTVITHIESGCPGDETGAIKLEVSGGTAPYHFRWSNTKTGNEIYNITAGYYEVTISDSLGCVESRGYFVDGPKDIYSYIISMENPGCGQSDGSMEIYVDGGTPPYTYHWSNDSIGKSISNVPAGVYTINVTDANDCEYSKTENLDSEMSPWVYLDSAKNTKCNLDNGEIHVNVGGGIPPYKLIWEDGARGFNRTNLAVGEYNLLVTDHSYCTAAFNYKVQSTSFLDPVIGLVSVDRKTGNNLVIWQKEETKEVDYYNIYRENAETREFDSIGNWKYNKISVYEDTQADTDERSWRYKLKAVNECGDKSRFSKSFKTMHMDTLTKTPEGIMLKWDDYEGELYPTYSIHRILGNDTTLIARVSSRISYYFDANPPKGVKYFVAVEMPEDFDVKDLLKAESGPFSLAMSNIAESEQSVNIENVPAVFNQISVYPTIVKDVVTVNVGNKQAQVSLFSIIGEKLYSAEVSQTAEINMSAMPHGIYTVVVTVDGVGYGYKVIVND